MRHSKGICGKSSARRFFLAEVERVLMITLSPPICSCLSAFGIARGCFGGEIADRDFPLGDFGHAAPFANGDLSIQRNGSFNRLRGVQASVGA